MNGSSKLHSVDVFVAPGSYCASTTIIEDIVCNKKLSRSLIGELSVLLWKGEEYKTTKDSLLRIIFLNFLNDGMLKNLILQAEKQAIVCSNGCSALPSGTCSWERLPVS